MGQKTHPKAFRLVTTEKHLSQWYSKKLLYSKLIEEDFFIREKILKTFADLFSVSKIEIQRVGEENIEKQYIKIIISGLFPRSKEMNKKVGKALFESVPSLKAPAIKGNLKKFGSFLLKRNIRQLIRFFQKKTKNDYFITLKFIKNPFEDAVLIAKYIGEHLEKRTPFRRAIKQTIKKVQKTFVKGIKIQVSGRLNGVEIARSEWKRDGRVPLHTLRAKIDYTHQRAETIYGVIGIKVWLFINEEN